MDLASREKEYIWTGRIRRVVAAPVKFAIRTTRLIPNHAMHNLRRLIPNKFRLPALYREMHAEGLFRGVTWRNSYELFSHSIPKLEQKTILDFGCGPLGGLVEKLGTGSVISYDPYVPKFATPPWNRNFDVLFSSDVLEHLTLQDVRAFAKNVRRSRPQFVFLNISTRRADKTFSNGRNVHLTVHPMNWWCDTLNHFWKHLYNCRVLRDRFDECTLLYTRIDV